jgi:acetyl esterase/lipase
MATTTPAVNVHQPLLNSIPESLLPRFDLTYVELYNKHNAGRLATHQVPIQEYRANPSKYIVSYGRQTVDPTPLTITEQKCPVKAGEIKIRICEPTQSSEGSKPRPVYINFHGGGWVFGDLETGFNFCKRMAIELDCVTFDVDYRLAPEYPFPTAVEDSWAAVNWVGANYLGEEWRGFFHRQNLTYVLILPQIRNKAEEFNLDLDRVAVGGCSCGGHLAAVMAHMCRDTGIPLALQLLAVPVTDLHVFTPTGELSPDCPYESYRELADTVPLSRARMAWFHNQFLGNPRPKELDGVSLPSLS